MSRLIAQLGLDLGRRFSRRDTSALLQALLTASESQLQALLANKRLPVAVSAVIRRVLRDAETGDTSTVERLWDRVFGKGAMEPQEAQPAQAGAPGAEAVPGLGRPMSREAYVVIRESLMR